jgi:hypothetical protein
MKPTREFNDKFLANEDQFQDPFFKRFTLRHAPAPLKLNDEVTKNYLFPTFYGDVTCAMAIFLCSYERAEKMMLHPKIKPIRMTRGRSLVAFSCYEYKNVMNVVPYNEIAMTIPVMVDPGFNVPVLPMIMPVFKNFGYYVFSMPVTSLENQIRGVKIWGLPKVVQEIDIREEGNDCVTTAMEESGEPYLELRVPMGGTPSVFDVSSNLYTRRGTDFFQSPTHFRGAFNVTKHMGMLLKKNARPDREYIRIHDTPCGKVLKDLDIEEHPFQFRFARHMNSCFDLPNPDFKSATISFGE